MRDPNRIFPFCNKLAKMWVKSMPDQRFGQLMTNFLGYVAEKTGKDIWFIEEPEMEKYIEEYEHMCKFKKGGTDERKRENH